MSWATEEVGQVAVGDRRLERRIARVLERLGARPDQSIPCASTGWPETQAAYRLLDNDKLSFDNVLAPHRDKTVERMGAYRRVLCIADSTEFDYTRQHKSMAGLGPLNYEHRRGLLGHFLLAATDEGVPLGLVGAQLWVRDDEHFGERALRQTKTLEEKETARWVQMAARCGEVAGQLAHTQVVYVADREADIHELLLPLVEGHAPRVELVIRSQHNRSQGKDHPYIHQAVAAEPCLGVIEFDLPATPKRDARHVRAEVRSCRVHLRGPRRPAEGGSLPGIPLNLVHVREVDAAVEEPIEWFLLTTLPIGNVDAAVEVIQIYRARWTIEVFFRILKTGCKVEDLQLEQVRRVRRALAFYAIIAWRVQFLTMLGRRVPELPCEVVFAPEEWQAIWIVSQRKPPPTAPPPLHQMIRMLASFGGFLGRKCDGSPGPKAIWIGIQRTRDFVAALQAQKEAATCV
jgi:Transposase Tn5 dimerisation domain/Transposase DNA-binding